MPTICSSPRKGWGPGVARYEPQWGVPRKLRGVFLEMFSGGRGAGGGAVPGRLVCVRRIVGVSRWLLYGGTGSWMALPSPTAS